ncbi:DUF4240 domain-containing protein [Streptomyces sp. NBC_01764]|uniref:DUF4240 domain-containing protein n=1 Tax=Streptomyces sp. NBC_01764 TaxID=2975935 RepID=UPI002B1CB03A|nr:DUF4240 domain-containing protein [Streptomyces sp. NBC_01764]
MDIDSFWKLIEECRRQTRDRDERLAWLRDELSRRPLTEIVQFQVRLDEVTHEAFTWDLWAAAERIFGGWCSDDGFCYFGLWMVGLGRTPFLGQWPIPTLWPTLLRSSAWRLALASSGTTTGPSGSLSTTSPRRRTGSLPASTTAATPSMKPSKPSRTMWGGSRGPFGEQWDVRSEAEAARKLPRLSAMFPLGPLAR